MQENEDGVRFLIVDDESRTRNGLRKYVRWNALGVGAVRCAANGAEALDVCRVFQPDVILSDVRMPGMDGVTLCRRVREILPRCRIIFLSGYSDKEYLKAAIELGAVDYVEKPTVIVDVERAVKKAVQLFTEEKSLRLNGSMLAENSVLLQRDLAETLISGSQGEMEPEQLRKRCSQLHLFEKGTLFFRVAVLRCEKRIASQQNVLRNLEKLLRSREIQFAGMVKDERHIVIIFGAGSPECLEPHGAAFHPLESAAAGVALGEGTLFCAAGETVSRMNEIPQSYRTAVIALQKLFFTGYGRSVFYRKEDPQDFRFSEEEFFQKLLRAMLSHDREETRKLLQEMLQFLSSHDTVLPVRIKSLYFRLVYRVLRFSGEPFDAQKTWEMLLRTDTLSETHRILSRTVEQALEHPAKEECFSPPVRSAMQKIRDDYSEEDLSVCQLADQVHLTAAYLSNLFKKETGMTVGQCIANVRMEHAKILLRNESNRLGEIASSVGYPDAGYFTRIFRKHIHMTPSEYRKQEDDPDWLNAGEEGKTKI